MEITQKPFTSLWGCNQVDHVYVRFSWLRQLFVIGKNLLIKLCYVILNLDAQKSNGMKGEKEFKKPILNKVSADTS